MTRTEMIALIRDRLGFNQALDEAIILRHMDMAQAKFENGEENLPRPWFSFDAEYEDQTQTDVRDVKLPEHFVAFHDDFPLRIVTTDGTVTKLYRRIVHQLIPYENDSGIPTHFDVQGDAILFFPKPDAAYTLHIPHYCRLDKLSDDADSVWFTEFPSLILEETLVSLCTSTRDETGLKFALARLRMAQDAYLRRVEERMHVLQEYVMGGDDA